MARTAFLMFAIFVSFLRGNVAAGTNSVGLCWGRQASHLLLPASVIDAALSNRIKKMRLISRMNDGVTSAFMGTNIEVIAAIENEQANLVNSTSKARDWLQENVVKAIDNGLKISLLTVANEPYRIVDNNTSAYQWIYHQNLGFIQSALQQDPKLNKIKATIAHSPDILKPGIEKPSQGDFREDLKDRMLQILQNLDSFGAPFMVNIYPMLTLHEKDYPLDFGFFDERSDFTIEDGDITYTNVFDTIFDTFVWALRKNGYKNMKIVVGQVGWPTDGDIYANVSSATRFYSGFLEKLSKNEGTPLYPEPLDAYIYSFFDEDRINIKRSPSERHYGIYTYMGKPKFHLDFTLEGRKDAKLDTVANVEYLPRRWMVFNDSAPNGNDVNYVMERFNRACANADCTKLAEGASCSHLDYKAKVSYAFNMYFQAENQGTRNTSWFDDLGLMVMREPYKDGSCKFIRQFMTTMNTNREGEMGKVLPPNVAGGLLVSGMTVIIPVLLIFFW